MFRDSLAHGEFPERRIHVTQFSRKFQCNLMPVLTDFLAECLSFNFFQFQLRSSAPRLDGNGTEWKGVNVPARERSQPRRSCGLANKGGLRMGGSKRLETWTARRVVSRGTVARESVKQESPLLLDLSTELHSSFWVCQSNIIALYYCPATISFNDRIRLACPSLSPR